MIMVSKEGREGVEEETGAEPTSNLVTAALVFWNLPGLEGKGEVWSAPQSCAW